MPFEYLLSLFLLLIFALVLRAKYKISVFRNIREVGLFYLIIFAIGTIQDNFAVWRGHWYYPGRMVK
jgi:lycopene cyclase domain-containing protein